MELSQQLGQREKEAGLGNGHPLDLSALLGNKPLGNLVLSAIHSIDANQLQPVANADAGIAFQPRVLLALLTYCYAVGILGSQDVQRAMESDQLFRLLCDSEFPNWHLIRRFRRLNREALRQCLEKTCLAAVSSILPFGRGGLPVNGSARLQTNSSEDRSLSAPQLSRQIENLIEQAVWLDSMELDT